MSSLSDRVILDLITERKLSISPLVLDNIQPGSIDLTLGDKIQVFKGGDLHLDALRKEDIKQGMEEVSLSGCEDGYPLGPGEFITGHSAELIHLPQDVNGLIMNRNSYAEIGLDAAISQYINPGFHGNKIIVIANRGARTLYLTKGLRVCTLVLFRMERQSIRTYDGRHDVDKLKGAMQRMNDMHVRYEAVKENADNDLADFMNEQIREIAAKGVVP